MKKLAIVIAAIFMMVSLGYSRAIRIDKDTDYFNLLKKTFEENGKQVKDAFLCTDLDDAELLTNPVSMWIPVTRDYLNDYYEIFEIVVIILEKATNEKFAVIDIKAEYTYIRFYTEL